MVASANDSNVHEQDGPAMAADDLKGEDQNASMMGRTVSNLPAHDAKATAITVQDAEASAPEGKPIEKSKKELRKERKRENRRKRKAEQEAKRQEESKEEVKIERAMAKEKRQSKRQRGMFFARRKRMEKKAKLAAEEEARPRATPIASMPNEFDTESDMDDSTLDHVLKVTTISEMDPLFVFTSLKDFCERMDGFGLKCFIIRYRKRVSDLHRQLIPALLCAPDPFLLVLEAVESTPSRNVAFIVLDCLFRLLSNPSVKAKHYCSEDMKRRAKEVAERFMGHMTYHSRSNVIERISPVVAWSFLQLLAIYGIVSDYNYKQLRPLIVATARRQLAPAVFRALGFSVKAKGIVDALVESKRRKEAIYFAYEFGIMDQLPKELRTEFSGEVNKLQQEKKNQNEHAKTSAVLSSELLGSRAASIAVDAYDMHFDNNPIPISTNEQEKAQHWRPIQVQIGGEMRSQGSHGPGMGAGGRSALTKGVVTGYEDWAKRPWLNDSTGKDAGNASYMVAGRTTNFNDYGSIYLPPPRHQYGTIFQSHNISGTSGIDHNISGTSGIDKKVESGSSLVFGANSSSVSLPSTYLHNRNEVGSSLVFGANSSSVSLPSTYLHNRDEVGSSVFGSSSIYCNPSWPYGSFR